MTGTWKWGYKSEQWQCMLVNQINIGRSVQNSSSIHISVMWCLIVMITSLSSGSVDFLDQPTMAFVRLQEAVLLDSVLEVPVPVRFLFILLGPNNSSMDYHQIGRSISTLMSDKVSCKKHHNAELVSPLFQGAKLAYGWKSM